MRFRVLSIFITLVAAVAGQIRGATPLFPERPHGIPVVETTGPAAPSCALSPSEPWIITSRVVVTEPMDVGDIIVAAGGELIVRDVPEPGFSLTGSLWVAQSVHAELRDSVIRFLSNYNGQYTLIAADDATVLVDGCDYRIPNHVQHALISVGRATVTVRDTDFGAVQLMAWQQGHLLAEGLNGRFEVILQDLGNITLKDIPRDPGAGALWVWPTFPEGSTAVYSPPLPGFIEAWDFPPAGTTGIAQTCHMERCQVLLWPVLVQPGSDLTLRNIEEDNWVVVGLHLPNRTSISGLVNGGPPATRTLDLDDRTLRLENAAIDTWNLYPEGRAYVVVEDSTVGEILALEDASLTMERTTVDGSGGYFGAVHQARVMATDSTFTCDVEATGDATIELHRCSALPYPQDPDGSFTRFGAYDRGRLLADTTTIESIPAVGGSGLIAVTWIADPPTQPPAWGQSAPVSGIAAIFSADPLAALSSWELEAVPNAGLSGPILGRGTVNVEQRAPLGVWPGGNPYVPWELRLILRDGFGRLLAGRTVIPAAKPGSPRTARPVRRASPR